MTKVYCTDAAKHKLLFTSAAKARKYIRLNGNYIKRMYGFDSNVKSVYRCDACGGWHLTHHDAVTSRDIQEVKEKRNLLNDLWNDNNNDMTLADIATIKQTCERDGQVTRQWLNQFRLDAYSILKDKAKVVKDEINQWMEQHPESSHIGSSLIGDVGHEHKVAKGTIKEWDITQSETDIKLSLENLERSFSIMEAHVRETMAMYQSQSDNQWLDDVRTRVATVMSVDAAKKEKEEDVREQERLTLIGDIRSRESTRHSAMVSIIRLKACQHEFAQDDVDGMMNAENDIHNRVIELIESIPMDAESQYKFLGDIDMNVRNAENIIRAKMEMLEDEYENHNKKPDNMSMLNKNPEMVSRMQDYLKAAKDIYKRMNNVEIVTDKEINTLTDIPQSTFSLVKNGRINENQVEKYEALANQLAAVFPELNPRFVVTGEGEIFLPFEEIDIEIVDELANQVEDALNEQAKEDTGESSKYEMLDEDELDLVSDENPDENENQNENVDENVEEVEEQETEETVKEDSAAEVSATSARAKWEADAHAYGITDITESDMIVNHDGAFYGFKHATDELPYRREKYEFQAVGLKVVEVFNYEEDKPYTVEVYFHAKATMTVVADSESAAMDAARRKLSECGIDGCDIEIISVQ